MNFNINDYVNGIFRGIVFFFYDYADSFRRLAFRPYRGGLALVRRSKLARLRQVGSHAFLYVSSLFILFVLECLTDTQTMASVHGWQDARAWLITVPHAELAKMSRSSTSIVLHFLVPALVQVVLVEIFAGAFWTIFFRRGKGNESGRRRLFIDLMLYNFGYQLVWFIVYFSILAGYSLLWESDLGLFLLVTLVFFFAFGAARIVPIGHAFIANRIHHKPPAYFSAIAYPAFYLFYVAANVAYLNVGTTLLELSRIDLVPDTLTLTKAECYKTSAPDAKFRALVVLKNESDETKIIRSDDFQIVLSKTDKFPGGGYSSSPSNSDAIVIASSFGGLHEAYAITEGASAWFYIEAINTSQFSDWFDGKTGKRPWDKTTDTCAAAPRIGVHSFAGKIYADYRGVLINTNEGPLIEMPKPPG